MWAGWAATSAAGDCPYRRPVGSCKMRPMEDLHAHDRSTNLRDPLAHLLEPSLGEHTGVPAL